MYDSFLFFGDTGVSKAFYDAKLVLYMDVFDRRNKSSLTFECFVSIASLCNPVKTPPLSSTLPPYVSIDCCLHTCKLLVAGST